MKAKIFQIESTQIIRIGAGILAIALILSHVTGLPHDFTLFFMGIGCALTLVGTGKRIWKRILSCQS